MVRPAQYSPSGHPHDAVKDEVHTFRIGDAVVTFVRMPIHREPLDGPLGGRRYGREQALLGHPGEQRRYAVGVDGAQVGWAVRHHGGGRRPYEAMAMFAGYEPGLGRFGYPELDGRRSSVGEASNDLADLAPKFAAWRRERMALTWDEIVEAVRLRDQKAELEKREAKARAAADDRKRERELKDRERGRLDALGGLEEIAARYDGELSNYQAEALQKAIDHFRSAGLRWHETEFLERMARGGAHEDA